jgi:DNA invertase Pin-like site-specific DNA recombinase
MKLAGYVRVSTDDQRPDLQRDALRHYAGAHGHELVQLHEDLGLSGADQARPGLAALMAEARRRRFQAVLVWKFDRFARSTFDLLEALQTFRSLGIDFMSVTEGVDTTTPAGKMVLTFLAAIAEFERGLISERITAGIRSARARGVRWARERPVDLGRARELLAAGHSMVHVARLLEVPRPTLIRKLGPVARREA